MRLFPVPAPTATLLLLCTTGCADPIASWALDPVFLVPAGDQVRGSQTWQLYDQRWGNRFSPDRYLCSIVVSFEATPSDPDCQECTVAFDTVPELSDTDCADAEAQSPLYTTLHRVGIGPLQDGGPYPEASSVAWVDYGNGWELHGWAHPEAVVTDAPAASVTWDGTEPFAFTPTVAWWLPDARESLTSMSRSTRIELD